MQLIIILYKYTKSKRKNKGIYTFIEVWSIEEFGLYSKWLIHLPKGKKKKVVSTEITSF